MATSSRSQLPPTSVGMASLIFGSVGLLLFIFPILSIPLAAVGSLFGILGLGLAIVRGWANFRWSLAGFALSVLTLAIGIAIAQTAGGNTMIPPRTATVQKTPDRPFVPPPARPGRIK